MLPNAPPIDDDDLTPAQKDILCDIAHPEFPCAFDQRDALRAQTRIAEGLSTYILSAAGVTMPRPPDIRVVPNAGWLHPRVVGFCTADLIVLLPAAGRDGVPLDRAGKHRASVWPPPPDPQDFRIVGLDADGWLRLLLHELVHVIEVARHGSLVFSSEEHHRPTYRAAVTRIRGALARKTPPPLPFDDMERWPLRGDPVVDAFVAVAEPAVTLHLAPPARWRTNPATGSLSLTLFNSAEDEPATLRRTAA
jgi:hypothetical protein